MGKPIGLYYVGVVSDTKPGYVKVFFEQDDFVSDWLPVCALFTLTDKICWQLPVNTQVACLMDENCDEGIVIGALYNDEDVTPDGINENVFKIKFSDGTYIQYDKSSHELKADVSGKVTVKASGDIKADSDTTIKATALVKATVEAPAIELKGNVTVLGTLMAGSITTSAGLGGADGKITGEGDIETTGNVKAATVEGTTEVKAGTILLSSHVHSGVTTGGGVSGIPVP